jgi:3-oxoacyl-[acyl-carrier-protein] synthase III
VAFYKSQTGVFISAPSVYLPPQRVTNEQVIAWMGASIRPDWIRRRTGIETRYWATDDEAVSDMAAKAAEALLERWPDQRTVIRQVVLATISGDYPTPPTSPLVQHRLGLHGVGCFDLGAACAGFTTGLYTAAALCETTAETQLVIAADIRSRVLNKRDFATCVLFGDGAVASLVSRDPRVGTFQFVAGELLSDGSVADLICLPAGGSRLPCHQIREPDEAFVRMTDGPRLFALAAEGMSRAAQSLLGKLDMTIDQVDWLVPHQANLHLVREVARQLECPPGKVIETVQRHGNTSGASVGLALQELCGHPDLMDGQRVLLVSAGGGGLAATALIRTVRTC